MSNITSASAAQIDHASSWNFRFAVFCSQLSIISTFILSVIAVKWIFTKSTFQTSTKIILVFNFVYANIHQFMYAIISLGMAYKGIFLLDETCEWLITEKDCLLYTEVLYVGISGMIYSQTGILIERAFATLYRNYTAKISRLVGIIISTFVLIMSIATYQIIISDDPLEGVVLSCFVPAQHSAQRANTFLFIALILTFVNLISSAAVMFYNKRLEYSIRYKVRERFKKREAIYSTHTICVVCMAQFVTMLVYSSGVLILRCNMSNILLTTFYKLITWVYTVQYNALLFPLILIFRIRATKLSRTKKIQDITSANQSQTEHYNQITSAWKIT
ncbi:Serpentine receptor class alpha-1 [Caenorhabditis elegans]|uniref:Serpentine receptor class alpha-1 n=1 Tax=Caenorhabditis elegans TaxID=6239 RepID=SRA1_CAEEL|nr:Serpentine receptor class alpha-1 [Caenorhabditis elegans]Q09203.1 RecName: Full=Serpentine receptor class alpha-1; Short=Protein sra-1 [Caenorhabditis elegans]CAA88078.1 Serpentine receptor class alpha-1 [Caenorhabditis elegans]prf//2123261A chemosensory receptor [Caenorhabditis elegans]|eukprot:NP_496042.1 Serpentine receptor class alpha-1 [Caenorhabditis elegans]